MSLNVNIERVFYGKREILSDISFAPQECSLTAVIGKNGSGKSTLISALSGLISYEGFVLVDGIEVKKAEKRALSRMISALPQDILRPHISVERLVSYGRSPYLRLGKGLGADDERIIDSAISTAQLSSIRDKHLDRISGGELRRAYFGMMLAQNTDVLLLDEATAFMDADFERRFLKMQRELAATKTVVSVMHDITLALSFADNVLLLDKGRQAFYGTGEALLATDLVERTFSLERHVADGRIFFA